jgi:Bacterial Ig domain
VLLDMGNTLSVSYVRVSHEGIVKNATSAKLRNIGNANAPVLNSFLAPGESADFSVRGKDMRMEDINYDSRATILEIVAVGGEPLVKNQFPVVAITSPVNNTIFTLGQPVTVSATASDADGRVISVTFKANGFVVGKATSSPYTATWFPSSVGTYALSAVATDDKYDTTETDNITIVVNKPD